MKEHSFAFPEKFEASVGFQHHPKVPVVFFYSEMARPTFQIINGNNRLLVNRASIATPVPSFLPVILVTQFLILLYELPCLSLSSLGMVCFNSVCLPRSSEHNVITFSLPSLHLLLENLHHPTGSLTTFSFKIWDTKQLLTSTHQACKEINRAS